MRIGLKHMVLKGIVALFFSALLHTMPAYADSGDEAAGTVVGAGLGGLVGSQFGHGPSRVATTVGGVFLGGLVGNQISRSLDRSSYATSLYPSYPGPASFQAVYVPNYVAPPAPPSETFYSSAAAYYDEAESDYCREFTQEIRVGGQTKESYGMACLQSDGSWRVVE
jgi:surface antigen